MQIVEVELVPPVPAGPPKMEDPDFEACFKALNWQDCPGTFIRLLSQPLSRRDAVESFLMWQKGQWLLSLHFVYQKHWDPKHKIPATATERKNLEPFAEVLFRILEMCIRLHSSRSAHYVSAAEWFFMIYMEAQERQQEEALKPRRKGQGKDSWVNTMREECKALKTGINPYSSEDLPHFSLLIDTALASVRSPYFRRDYWVPFTRALSTYATTTKENAAIKDVFIEGDELQYRSGRGRHTVKMKVVKPADRETLAGRELQQLIAEE